MFDVSNLYVRSGHGQNMKDVSGEAITPRLMNIRTDGEVRSGKINEFFHLYMDFVNVFADGTTPDEVWGVLEKGSASGRSSKNYFSGNTKFGGSSGYNDITEKLMVDGNVDVTGTVSAGGSVLTSDERLKTNIKPLDSADSLAKIQNIQGKTYNLKSDEDRNTQYGVIAQEIEQILPELVSEGQDGIKKVNYIGVIPVLVEAIKEQQKQINSFIARLDS